MTSLRRVALWLALVALSGLVVGCDGVSTGSADDVRDNIDRVESILSATTVRLPSVAIEINDEGRIERVAGFRAADVDNLAELVIGSPLIGRISLLNEEYVDWFRRSNIQHITLASRPEGLFLMVNGRPLPYLAWDETRIENLVETIGKFERDGRGAYLITEDGMEIVSTVLPLLQALNIQIDVLLPVPQGEEEIPTPGPDAFDLALTTEELEAIPLQTVQLDIEYKVLEDSEGRVLGWVPSIKGFTTADLQAVSDAFGTRRTPLWRLRNDIRTRMLAEDIETMGFEVRADGMFVSVDGELMPNLAWSEATLSNVSYVLSQLYPADVELPADARWVPAVRATSPLLNDLSVALLLRFPEE